MMEAVLGADIGGARTPAAVGDFLAGVGLTVDVVGPKGLVATLGSGVDSAIGAWVSGTRHVRFGSVGSAGPLAVARLRRPDVGRQVTMGAVALVALVVADATRRRRARHP